MININKEPDINVGIVSGRKINFELHGDFKVRGMSQTFSGRFTAEVIDNKIILTHAEEKLEITNEIVFVPQDFYIESFIIRDVTIGINFHWQRKEKQRFNGVLRLLMDEDNIVVVNIIPAENYLASVVSSEMSARSSLQLLKTHAIISRSWLLAQIEKSKRLKKKKETYSSGYENEDEVIRWYGREDHKLFDVCADDHCQRYQGVTKVFTEAARNAVKQTAGVVLISDNNICDARYSKSCGGITESFENVWEPVKYKYLKSIIDYKFEPENFRLDFTDELNSQRWIKRNPNSFCNVHDRKILSQVLIDYDQSTTDYFRWKIEYRQQEISKIIRMKTGIDFGDIIDLLPVERGLSARLIKLKIVGTKKTLIIGKELEIRRVLSTSHLYSSAICFEKVNVMNNIPQRFIIWGAGWGHGVGLCQIGAAVMAAKGYQFDEILLHYFSGATLKKIY